MVDVNKNWSNGKIVNKSHSKEDVLGYLNFLDSKSSELNSLTQNFYKEYSKKLRDNVENNLLSILFLSFFTIPLGVFFDFSAMLISILTLFLGLFLGLGVQIGTSIKNTYNFNIFELIFLKADSRKKEKFNNLTKLYRENKKILSVFKFLSGKKRISSFFRRMSFTSYQLEYLYFQTFRNKLLNRFISALERDFERNEQIEILSNYLLDKKENVITSFFKEHLLKIVQEEKVRHEEQLIYAENATILKEQKSDVIANINNKLSNASKKLSYIKSL